MPAPKQLLKGFERVVATAKPDTNKRVMISDPDTRGLFVRITPKGSRSYTVVARDPYGKQVWAAIGEVDDLTLEDARAKAREGVRRIKAGEMAFPKAEPLVAPEPPETVYAAGENFIVRYVQSKRLRSEREIKRILDKYVYPDWRNRPIEVINRKDVAKLLDKIEDNNGKVMADRVLATISKLFNWHATRNDDYSTPIVRGMGRADPAKDRARKRTLSDDEIRALWTAATGTFGAFAKICLLSGQRRAKVATMKWDDIAEDGTWIIAAEAREKDNAGTLKLPKMAHDIIKARPKINGNDFVFAGRGKKAMAAFSQGKAELDERLPIPEWRIHDLRRTAATLMEKVGVRPDIVERALGHALPGIVPETYRRHPYEVEKADALERLAAYVAAVLDPPEGNIVPLRAAVT